jgi:iron complex outermembrane recepter protein
MQRTGLGSLLIVFASSSLVAAQQPPADEPQAPEQPEQQLEQEPEGEAPGEPEAAPEPAPAEEEPAPDEPAPFEEEPPLETMQESGRTSGDEIIVTGTRIRRSTSFQASAPVEVIDRKQLEYSGAANLADVVQYLTVAQGQGAQGGNAVGAASQINLRGLGSGATLVLINGRRTNPAGASLVGPNYADLSVIPLAAVERIEILKGGASAIYGADAVGGVVNVITRRNFDGARLQLDGQTTSRMDHGEFTASGAWGATSERSRVLLGMSYFRRNQLNADDRDFTRGSYISTQGFPGTFLDGATLLLDDACETVPGSMARPGATGANVCGFDYREFWPLFGNQERANAFGSAEYDLTNHLTLFGELVVSRFRGDTVTSPSYPLPPPFPTVPADHVDNPYGRPLGFIGRPLGREAGHPRNTTSDDSFRGVVGLRGDFEDAASGTFLEDWDWELFGTFGISRYQLTTLDNLRQPFQDALNSCSDPTDLSRCFNPFYSSVDGTGTPNSQAVINGFSGQQVVLADHALQTYNAGMAGSLFELPGGDLGMAFGGEIRREWRTSALDHDANELRYGFILGNDDATALRNVYSAYLELRWPFFDGVELQTAARLEHYDDTDATPLSPFAGLTLIPSEIIGRENTAAAFHRLQLRANASQAFRAPTVFNTFPGCATLPTALRIPPSALLPVFTPVRVCGNPDLDPENALALSGGFSWAPIDELSLTSDFWHYDYKKRIQGENAQQIIILHQAAGGFMGGPGDPRVEVDPTTGDVSAVITQAVNVDGSWVTNGLDFGAMINLNGETFGGSADDFGRISFGAQGTYTMTFDIPRHQAANRTLTATMALPPADCENNTPDIDVNDGNPDTNGNPTDACSVVGKRNANNAVGPIPRWRVNFPVIWTISDHSATAIGHYISGVEDDIEPRPDGSFDQIASWFSLDLQYGYTLKDVIGEELAIRVGCYNVFDKMPPRVNGLAAAYEVGLHDPRGRMFYARLSSQF